MDDEVIAKSTKVDKKKVKVRSSNLVDGSLISNLFTISINKMLLLSECLPLPIDQTTVHSMRRSITSPVGKIDNIRTERLRMLEAPLLSD